MSDETTNTAPSESSSNEASGSMLTALLSSSPAPARTASAAPAHATDAQELGLETPAAAPAKPAAQTPPQPASLKNLISTPRNLEGLDEAEQKLFKNMSKEAYERLYPLYLEYRQLAPHKDKLAKLPELEKELTDARSQRWYDHPNAFQLTDEFQTLTAQRGQLAQVYNHFAAQIDALNSGAKEVELLKLDENGQLQIVPSPVSASTARQLQEELIAARTAQDKLADKLSGLKEQHAARYNNHKTGLAELRQKFFGEYADVLKDHSAKHLASFPPYFQQDPAAPILADAIALITLAGQALNQQSAQAPARAANAAAAKNSPPTRNGIRAATGPASNLSLEEYKQLKAAGMV